MSPDVETTISSLREKVGELDATVRVVKHDVANLHQGQSALVTKLDKIEDRLGAKIDNLKTKQDRNAGFWAGVAIVLTLPPALLLGLAKILFGGHP